MPYSGARSFEQPPRGICSGHKEGREANSTALHTQITLILIISSIVTVANELSCRCEGSGSQPPSKRQKARCHHGWRALNEK